MSKLKWKRDPVGDTWTAKVKGHEYLCMRTGGDVAVLYHNSEEIRRSRTDGSHCINKAIAEFHYKIILSDSGYKFKADVQERVNSEIENIAKERGISVQEVLRVATDMLAKARKLKESQDG